MKNESVRTLVFVGVAVISIVVAIVAAPTTEMKPSVLADAELGTEFYPGFKDPNEPTSLRVVSFNEAQALPKPFSVEFKNGLWTIPSHHNYPADAVDRLAKTAASAIGIKKDQFHTTNTEDFAELGVVDPLDGDTTQLKGRGQRITLSKGDTVLMDLIIGKQLKDRPGHYFVRVPKKNAVYVAKLDIDISTQFGDWVETDLLKLNRDDLVDLVANNYSVDETAGRVNHGETVRLHRDKPSDPWTLRWRPKPTDSWQDVDSDKEELDTAKVNTVVDTLDNLKLTGVRPKPAGLKEDLKKDEGIQLDQMVMMDLRNKGFMFTNRGELVSNEGEFLASTDKGIEYVLRFGEVFTGDSSEVESGIEADRKKDKAGDDKQGGKDKADDKKDEKKSNRYLFVQAQFNEQTLGPKPKKPKKPNAPAEEEEPAAEPAKESKTEEPAEEEKPAEKTEETAADKEAADKEKDADKKEEKEKESPPCGGEDPADKSEEKPAEEKPAEKKPADEDAAADTETKSDKKKPDAEPAEGDAEKPAEPAKKEAADKPEDAAKPDAAAKPGEDAAKSEAPKVDPQKEYDEALKKYKADIKAYDEKVKSGKEQVAKLNQRFADWYYVISAESFEKLRVGHKELVKTKAAAAGADKDKAATEKPDAEKPEGDEKPESDDDKSDADAKPDAKDKPEPDEKESDAKEEKPAEKSTEAKPADAKPTEDKPESKPADPKKGE